ncbi:MAG: DEAD/DEAH box helicase [Bacteroidota bacterium]
MEENKTFEDFSFNEDLLDGLDAMGFQKPTPIQEEAIPVILEGKDLIACAQTGTGKTAAFLLPILDKIYSQNDNESTINAVIIVPTRELALQIDQAVEGFAYFINVSSLPIYGGGDGMSWEQQKKALVEGVDIVVATPGRFISHLNMDYVDLSKVSHLILDEADRMLDMGFLDDIVKIINYLPKERQNLLFSATMPPTIRTLAKKILVNPEQINLAISKPAAGVLQAAYMVYDENKIDLVCHLIKGKSSYPSILIFSSTRKAVNSIVRALRKNGFQAEGISSDLEQKQRETVLREFKSRRVQILVATDILSRGIDIKDISLVINFDVPSDAEDYVHRVGRTARAASTGVAVTFISPKDQRRFYSIEQLIEMEVRKMPTPPEIGESPKYNPGKKGKGGKRRNFRHKNRGNRKPRGKRK